MTTENEATTTTKTAAPYASTAKPHAPRLPSLYISGYYTLHDIKFDLLKIIEPYDGYMFNRKDTEHVRGLFNNFLSDLRRAYKLREYNIYTTVKDNSITFDVTVKIHKDRAVKKLKIHVGRLNYVSPTTTHS
tara:strand:+ start:146 stop:541 length:396 start_codon:yes stop_codon:yes gene_type:complete